MIAMNACNTCCWGYFLHVILMCNHGNLGFPCFDIRVIFAAREAKSLTDGWTKIDVNLRKMFTNKIY